MDDKYKAKVTNNMGYDILIVLPYIKFKRTWGKGATFAIPLEVLREAVYDRGFMVLLEKGMMSIDEKEVRVELGLEEPEAEEPVFKAYNRSQIIKLLKVDKEETLKEALENMSKEQRSYLAEIAITEKIGDMAKAELIKQYSGIDIIKAIQLKIQNEE